MYMVVNAERERERETDETRLKSWLRQPKTLPQSRILRGAICVCERERARAREILMLEK